MHHFEESPANAAGTLDRLAYAGLCAFVVALSSGGDGWIVGGTVFSTWLIVLSLGFAALRIAVTRTIRRPASIHVVLMAFTALCALSYAWTVDRDSTAQRFGTCFALVIFVLLLWEFAATPERVRGLMISYILGAGIASLTTTYNYMTGQNSYKPGESWNHTRFSVDGTNADELALIVALSVPMALYLLVSTKNRSLKTYCWIHLIIAPIGMFLSGTRGAVIALACGLAILGGAIFSRMSWIQRSVAVTVGIGVIAGLVLYGPQASLGRFLSIGQEVTQGTLTHRTVLWAAGLQVFRTHPFLGVGAGAYGPATVRMTDIPLIAHNTFLSVLVELGVVGALVFAALMIVLLYNALQLPYLERRTWLALLATWAVGAGALSWEHRKTTWFLFGLLAAHASAARVIQIRREIRVAETSFTEGHAQAIQEYAR